jgi:hypothetical protein
MERVQALDIPVIRPATRQNQTGSPPISDALPIPYPCVRKLLSIAHFNPRIDRLEHFIAPSGCTVSGAIKFIEIVKGTDLDIRCELF